MLDRMQSGRSPKGSRWRRFSAEHRATTILVVIIIIVATLIGGHQKPPLHAEVNKLDWTQGVGPKMKQIISTPIKH